MTYGREALLALRCDSGPRVSRTVKRISFFVRDSRDLREKRDWSETSSSRVALVAHISHISCTSCARWDRRYERLAHGQAGR